MMLLVWRNLHVAPGCPLAFSVNKCKKSWFFMAYRLGGKESRCHCLPQSSLHQQSLARRPGIHIRLDPYKSIWCKCAINSNGLFNLKLLTKGHESKFDDWKLRVQIYMIKVVTKVRVRISFQQQSLTGKILILFLFFFIPSVPPCFPALLRSSSRYHAILVHVDLYGCDIEIKYSRPLK